MAALIMGIAIELAEAELETGVLLSLVLSTDSESNLAVRIMCLLRWIMLAV